MNAPTPMPTIERASLMGRGARPSEAEMALAMLRGMSAAGQSSTAEMLQELRRAFPHSPLSVRIAALEAFRSR